MEIRRSYDRLISTVGFPMLVRWHLHIESGPRFTSLALRQSYSCPNACEATLKNICKLISWITEQFYPYPSGLLNWNCELYDPVQVNSLWPSDAIWRQWSRLTLVQVMACCLTAPSHYLNQCWLIITVTFIWGQFHLRHHSHQSISLVWKLFF